MRSNTTLSWAALCCGLTLATAVHAQSKGQPRAFMQNGQQRSVASPVPSGDHAVVRAGNPSFGGVVAGSGGSQLRGIGPVNDACANATALTVNAAGACPGAAVAGDNGSATHDGNDPACDFTGTGFQDVWYSFNSGTNTSVTIDLGLGTIGDIGVEFLQGGCAGASIFCDYTAASYTVPVLPATSYRIRIFSNNDFGTGGTFDICLSAGGSAPANDQCTDVVPVSLAVGGSVNFSGTTIGATSTNDAVPGSSLDIGGDTTTVWHAFTTTTCANIAVSYCGTPTLPDVYWAFLSPGCPAGDDALLFDDGNFTDCLDENATIFFFDVPAGTYYLPVRGEPSTAGPYFVSVSATACAGGDVYCDASAVVNQFEKISNVTFSNINNSSTSSIGYENYTGITGNVVRGQSYPISITVSGGYDTDQGLVWIDFDQSGSFEPGELVFSSTAGVGPYNGNVSIPVTAALGQTRMRIRLHDTHDGSSYPNTPNDTPCDTSTYGQVEDYTLNITAGGEPPVNDQCGDVVPLALAAGGSLTFEGDNTDATITGDFEPGSDLEAAGYATVWHAFTTTECTNITVDYCATEPAFLDFWVFLSAMCPASDDIVLYTSVEFTSCVNGNITIQYQNLPAGTWYLPVMNDPAIATYSVGPYSIEVNATACGVAPPNDNCAGAIALDVNLTCEPTQGTVLNGTQSLPGITCNGFNGIANDDVWYTFIATGPNQTITVDGTDTLDAVIELFEGTCDGLVSLDCADATLGGGVEEIVATDLVEGGTYFVRIYDYYNGYPIEPTFTICVTGDIGTGIQGSSEAFFSLRPNPANAQVMIDLAGPGGSLRMEILDAMGRTVQSEQRNMSGHGTMTVDLAPGIAAGLYTVRLIQGERTAEQRLMVE